MNCKKTIFTTLLLLLWGAACFFSIGCEDDQFALIKPQVQEVDESSDVNERAHLAKENRQLKRELDKQKADNAILESRVKELTSRERQLAKKASALQLDNNQLKRQVEIYSELPAERDRYKLKYESAMKTVARLKARLEALNGKPATVVDETVEVKAEKAQTATPTHRKVRETPESLPSDLPQSMPTTLPLEKSGI